MSFLDASPYLDGNYEPVKTEITAVDLKVRGKIPEELNGRFLRNGPNPIEQPDLATHHWFLGDGMVHGIRLREGKAAWYRSRFVGSRRVHKKFGETHSVSTRAEIGPNTNIIEHANRTLAIVEAGTQPVELNYELDTVGTHTFEGTLNNGFSAHPKYDPLTGELHVMAYSPRQLFGKLEYIVVNKNGLVTKTIEIEAPTMPMVHDMGLTQKYAAVFDLPVAVDIELAMSGNQFPFRWFNSYEARIGLLPRSADSGEEIVWCNIDPCFAFHPLNSFDDANGCVVIDVCCFDKMFDCDRNGPFRDSLPRLERWTINPRTQKTQREVIDDRSQEFPRVAQSVLYRKHRYGYTAQLAQNDFSWDFSHTLKHDLLNSTTEVHEHGPGRSGAEPVFVAREHSLREDDGWIMTLVYDEATNRSDLVIFEAANFTDPEVARIELPERIPHGFHGNWVPDKI
jgi:carotenoid cleavage dioxygenase-like enzyme